MFGHKLCSFTVFKLDLHDFLDSRGIGKYGWTTARRNVQKSDSLTGDVLQLNKTMIKYKLELQKCPHFVAKNKMYLQSDHKNIHKLCWTGLFF
jgi:hypothetical protein